MEKFSANIVKMPRLGNPGRASFIVLEVNYLLVSWLLSFSSTELSRAK